MTLEKDDGGLQGPRGSRRRTDWSATRSGDGVFYVPEMAQGLRRSPS